MIKFTGTIELTEETALYFKEATKLFSDTLSEFNLFEIVLEEYAKGHLQSTKGDLEPWNL